ncbi:hypothetical protein BIV60_16220 [Bacillus sp. MUM 116]|uniref:hypothetical protein n=1 Tax=Bacillus sp. MUM 116 TaxID=1678002 RepID=UPI0008F5BA34|nr:hypothetical protein [Bacillus sp. MUM 116]OIK12443.1 hypothetical protein BIV60_16220 [Bacillus sp. MUM 116]
MKGKIIPFLVSVIMVITPLTAYAKGFSGGRSVSHSSYHSQTNSHTYHSSGSYNSQTNGSTYHSGYKSPSSNVTNHTSQNSGQGIKPTSKSRGILSHVAAFGAGTLLGSMFHPFGGGYATGGHTAFSLSGVLLDILVILLIIWVVRKLFFRRA